MQHLPEAPAAATCISPAAAPPPRAAAPDRPVEPGHALLARDADEGVHGALVERGARGLAHFYAHVLRLQPRLDNPERVGDEHRGRARAGRGRHVHRRRLRPARVDARADGHLQPLVRRKVDLGRRGGEAGREEETHGVGSRGPGPFLARAGRQSVTQVPPRSPPSLGAAQTAWARAPYTAPARPLPALSWRGRLRRAEQGGAGEHGLLERGQPKPARRYVPAPRGSPPEPPPSLPPSELAPGLPSPPMPVYRMAALPCTWSRVLSTSKGHTTVAVMAPAREGSERQVG